MKSFLLWSIIIFPFWGNTQEYYRTEKLCNKYSEYFGKDTVKWNKDDSLAAFEYNKKLYQLYKPIKEFYFSGEHPDQLIYSALHYDSTLLFYTLKLYGESRQEYDMIIGLPIGLVEDLISRDATIFGTVVDRINEFKESRWFRTTYLVRTDSVVFSYFPIKKGDTLLLHSNLFPGVLVDADTRDYKTGDSGYCFRLSRQGYVRHFHDPHISHMGYCDPFCTNSFIQYLGETSFNCLRDADPEKVREFVSKIKKWY
jgi:hypothetical protein